MLSKLFGIFKRKKKDEPVAGQPLGGATTSVPTAGVAVGAGIGAAQPGEPISQINPVPNSEPVNQPTSISTDLVNEPPAPPVQPEPPIAPPVEQPTPGEPTAPSSEPVTNPEQPQSIDSVIPPPANTNDSSADGVL